MRDTPPSPALRRPHRHPFLADERDTHVGGAAPPRASDPAPARAAFEINDGAPIEALLSATRNGAQLMRRDDLGVSEPGAIADILVVDGDPLEDIGNMRQLLVVIKEGEVMLDRTASEQTSR